MNTEKIAKISLAPHREKRLTQGHLWVFSNEIARHENVVDGDLVEIYSHQNKFLGIGFYNSHSLIAARILSVTRRNIDVSFFAERIRTAQILRANLYPKDSAYRLIFGESDALPGLIVDRYDDTFVIQSYCLGMDHLMPLFVEALQTCFTCDNIVLKNDSSIRDLEQVPKTVSLLKGEGKFPIEIQQHWNKHTAHFWVHPMDGQKSGFFFDQRENRELLAACCKDKTVLDCFSYSGAFGIYAALADAKSVTTIDSSQPACDLAKKNFALNDVPGPVLCQDVETALKNYAQQKNKFDIIVLDPPAFAKTKKNYFAALRKYQQLNALALKLISPNGLLISCSCSHHVSRADFMKVLAGASQDAERFTQIIELRSQSKDHPISPAMPETEYLKCAWVRVV